MKKIIIIGAGGHAAELQFYIHVHNNSNPESKYQVMGFIDDDAESYQQYDFAGPFLGGIQDHKIDRSVEYLMGIANIKYRRPIIEAFIKKGARFTGFIHPSALIDPSAKIGKGVVISHNSSVGPNVVIGKFNMLNSRCTIGHDSKIGNYNFISPQVVLGGYTTIGDENMIGTNACTLPKVKIGNKNKIAAGMAIYRKIGDSETVIFRHKERLIIRNSDE